METSLPTCRIVTFHNTLFSSPYDPILHHGTQPSSSKTCPLAPKLFCYNPAPASVWHGFSK